MGSVPRAFALLLALLAMLAGGARRGWVCEEGVCSVVAACCCEAGPDAVCDEAPPVVGGCACACAPTVVRGDPSASTTVAVAVPADAVEAPPLPLPEPLEEDAPRSAPRLTGEDDPPPLERPASPDAARAPPALV